MSWSTSGFNPIRNKISQYYYYLKMGSKTTALLLTVIIILSKTVSPLILSPLLQKKLFVHSNYWSAPRLQFFSSNNAQYFFDITYIIFFETTKVSKCIHNDIEKGLKISSFLIYFLCIFILIERNYQNKAIHEKENIIM